MVKRFLLFTGSNYYPSGGWSDYRDSYATREEALVAERSGDSVAGRRYAGRTNRCRGTMQKAVKLPPTRNHRQLAGVGQRAAARRCTGA